MNLFTSAYTHNRSRSKAFSTKNTEESMTQQSDAQGTDINVIVKQFTKTGQLPQVQAEALHGDFTTATNFRDMLDKVRIAKDAFSHVPADIRKRFDNDPQKYMDFIHDPNNIEEMRKMGLANPKPEAPKPMEVRVVPDPEQPK